MTPLDPETWLKVNTIVSQAQRSGWDIAEQLHRAGLILTPAKELHLRIGGMRFLHQQLVSWRPIELLRRKFHASHPTSPADMYACIAEFMEEHIKVAEKGPQ
jgi:hypothetical protein